MPGHHFFLTHAHRTNQKCIQTAPQKLQPWGLSLSSPGYLLIPLLFSLLSQFNDNINYPLLLSPFLPSQHRAIPPSWARAPSPGALLAKHAQFPLPAPRANVPWNYDHSNLLLISLGVCPSCLPTEAGTGLQICQVQFLFYE